MIDSLFESNLFYLLMVVIVIAAMGIIYVLKLNSKKDRKVELIIGISAGVSIILVMYNLILTTHSNIRIEKNRIAHITLENIQRNWLSPQIELSNNYPEGFFLYKSMTQDVDYGIAVPIEYDSVKRIQIEISTSIRIFQAMEDFLTIGSHDLTGSNVWINNFLMWLHSPILKKNWRLLSFNSSSATRQMVNLLLLESDKLVELRRQNGKLSNEDYDKISKDFDIEFR